MKYKFKSLFAFIMSLMMIFTNINPIAVSAATYITSSKSHNSWWLAVPTDGRRDDKEGELLVNGERAFCIDAFTKFKSGVEMKSADWKTVGIDEELAEELSLISYFGTQVSGRTSDDWYAITQGLIWKVRHEYDGHTDMCYVETPTNPDYATTVKCWNQILADVKAYKKTPSFVNKTFEVNDGASVTVMDENSALGNMIVKDAGGLDVTISGKNKLIINSNGKSKDDVTITLQRNIKTNQVGTSLVFYNGKDQSLARFKVSKPLEFKVKVHVNKFGKLELTKFNDDKSGTIPRTTFQITGPNGYDETLTTDENGKIIIDRLALGNYKVVETKSADGYLINVTEYSFTIKANETTSLELINNEPLARVEISKVDSETGQRPQGDASLKGAIYELRAAEDIYNKAKTEQYYSMGDVVATRTTDEKGQMETIDNLHLGHYQLVETEASLGYLIDKNVYDIFCEYEGETVEKIIRTQVSKENVKKQAFEILKISSDGETGEVGTLTGAEFTVKLMSEVEKVGWNKAKIYDTLITDKKGYAKSKELPYGTYIVKETKTPLEHTTIKDFTVVIEEDSRAPQEWRVFNDAPFKALIKAVKMDKETGKTILLEGTEFKIKNLDSGEYVGDWVWFPVPHYVDTFVTDETGTVMTPESLEAGRYALVEVKAPYGYVLDDTPIEFEVSSNQAYEIAEDEVTPVIVVTKDDVSAKGAIEIYKTGERLTGIETDENGNIHFIYTEMPVSGAEFVVEAAEDIYSADNQKNIIYKKGDIVAELPTLEGKAVTDNLPLGKYNVYEKYAGDGFVLNKEVKKVELTYANQSTTVVFKDVEFVNERPKVDINVIKQDAENETLLSGAVFGLYAKEDIYGMEIQPKAAENKKLLVEKGTLIEKATSNEDGSAEFTVDLPLGLYEIREITSPIGYASTDFVYEVDVRQFKQDQAVIVVEPIFKNEIIKVEVSKKDATTDKELPGAHLIVREKNGPEFESWISGNEPHFIKGLEVGKIYELIETSSPYGFAISQKVEFKVEDTGEIQKVEMKDDLVVGKLKWLKTGEVFTHTDTGQTELGKVETPVFEKTTIANAEISIYAVEDIVLANSITYFEKDELIETLKSGDKAVESKELPVGKYYYVETVTPEPFIQDNEKHYFEIVDSQESELQIIESELENMQATVTLNLNKIMEKHPYYDVDYQEVYKNVVFGIFAKEQIIDYIGNPAIKKDVLIATCPIDKKGQLVNVPRLPIGQYYLKELTTDNNYILDENTYDFDITYVDKDTKEVEIDINEGKPLTNKLKRTDVIISKIDKVTKKPLSKVEFTLYDKNMKEISKSLSDEKGIAKFEGLANGIYYCKETKAREGYALSDEVIKIELDGTSRDNEYHVTMTNVLLPAVSNVVQTGDNINIGVLLCGLTISSVIILATLKLKKKNDEDE